MISRHRSRVYRKSSLDMPSRPADLGRALRNDGASIRSSGSYSNKKLDHDPIQSNRIMTEVRPIIRLSARCRARRSLRQPHFAAAAASAALPASAAPPALLLRLLLRLLLLHLLALSGFLLRLLLHLRLLRLLLRLRPAQFECRQIIRVGQLTRLHQVGRQRSCQTVGRRRRLRQFFARPRRSISARAKGPAKNEAAKEIRKALKIRNMTCSGGNTIRRANLVSPLLHPDHLPHMPGGSFLQEKFLRESDQIG